MWVGCVLALSFGIWKAMSLCRNPLWKYQLHAILTVSVGIAVGSIVSSYVL